MRASPAIRSPDLLLHKTQRFVTCYWFAVLPAWLLMCSAGAAGFSIGMGSEYSSGSYGSRDNTNVFSVPMYAKYWTGPFTLRVSTSWLRVTGPGTIVPSGIGGIGVSGGASIPDSVSSSASGASVSGGGTGSAGSTGSTSGSGGTSSGTGTSGGSGTSGGTSGGGTGTSGKGGSGGSGTSGGGGTGTTTTAAVTATATPAVAATAAATAAAPAAAPVSTTTGSGGAAAAAVRRTQEGFSDLVAALTYTAVNFSGYYLDVTGKIKFATASENRGLGSGKNDYALQVDGEKSFGPTFITAGIGSKWLGDATDNSLHRVWYGAAGAGHKLSADDTLGLSYNYTKAAQVNGQPAKEAVVYYSHRIDRHFRLNANVIKGLSDGSADWGAGLSIAYSF